ncbi:MAG: hypothetical protein GKC04_06820 [Methanomicrobiales archaeon]|nr:hypothetical protein [Methanomicrobiales archaeon]
MDQRVIDSATSGGSLVLLLLSLTVLPMLLQGMEGYAYLLAIIVFILAMSVAGWKITGQSA